MKVNTFTSVNPNMSNTRTYEDFSKFIGSKPARFGIVSRMFPNNTTTYITESLQNIFYNDTKKANKFQSINSLYYEWEIETNEVKRIPFADVPVGTGANGTEITMAFTENYYQMNDTFEVEATHQQFFVTATPTRKNDQYWEVQVRIIDNDYSSVLDDSGCQIGMTTRWIGNAFPELHEFGFVKYQSNVSKMRNYLTTVRCDDSYSSLYKIHEDVFVKLGKGEGSSEQDKETVYKLDGVKANLMMNFNQARNNMMLLSKGNVDVNGKPTLYDKQNRPIFIGEGVIPQVERYASKYAYNKLTMEVFNTMINALGEKADNPTGNHYMIVCNEALWQQVNTVLGKFLSDNQTDGTYLWSKGANNYVKVGAAYNSYTWAGNTVTFSVDRALTREYGSKGYGLCLDLTADETRAMPAIAMFTLRNGQCIQNYIKGVGGEDGLSSGEVSSPVAGSKLAIHGYCGAAVFNPYRSFIIREA